MSPFSPVLRLVEYYKRHGIADTWRRFIVGARRELFESAMAVFYCDFHAQAPRAINMPKAFAVRRINAASELSAEQFEEFVNVWNAKVAAKNAAERFSKGASVWLVEHEGKLAGYGWTLRGRPIAPYYFPLGKDDVQLFDFYVLPKLRGRGVHWLLTSYILHALSNEGASRAYADTHEWNKAQLAAFKMTPFRHLGTVRTCEVFGRLYNRWMPEEPVGRTEKAIAQGATRKYVAQ